MNESIIGRGREIVLSTFANESGLSLFLPSMRLPEGVHIVQYVEYELIAMIQILTTM